MIAAERSRARAKSRTRAAWTLPPEGMPVSVPAAPDLRLGVLEAWLAELGYEPTRLADGRPVRSPRTVASLRAAARGLVAAPGWALRAVRERPALVLTNTALNAPAVALIKLLLRSRVVAVADVMGIRSRETEQTTRARVARAVYRPVWARLERTLFSSADLVLAVNDRHAAVIRATHGCPAVHTLRDSAEEELARLARGDRHALGVPSEGIAVCFVGSLVCSRLDPIFAAWSTLAREPERSSPLHLVVIGEGPDLRSYERYAAAQGWLGRSVFFLGGLPRIQALAALRACDIAYTDCWSEAGFPFKVFEYLALGMPIVIEAKPQAAEVLSEGRDALFARTPDDLARNLHMLAGSPELRARLGTAARETFLAAHTRDIRRGEFERIMTAVARP